MNSAPLPHARATADDVPPPSGGRPDREGVVAALAVTAVTVAAVLAAVMHAPPGGRPDAPRPALAGEPVQAHHTRLAACTECGVVEAVVPPGPETTAWRLRIRMDDGTTRTVEQRGALAAGARVMVAGGSIRVLSNRPGQG